MSELKNIWLDRGLDRIELRIDWSNDRHQAIKLDNLEPDTVKRALIQAAQSLIQEQENGNI